jgi:iron complex outermembrane receptor protein
MKASTTPTMFRRAVLSGASVVAVCAALAPGVAAAADTAVGEVVVTASRRSERLMDVPMSVTAVTTAQLKDGGLVTSRELGQVTPGLSTITNGKVFQPAIRGVSSSLGTAGEEQNVAIYIDDVYMAVPTGNVFSMRNLERVEVLKGPQGTLFGRNATGGAIRVFTRDPGQTREFNLSAAYGTELKSKEYSFYAATPITDTLAFSLSGEIYDDKGYLTNLTPGWTEGKLGSSHNWSARTKLKWTPTSDFSAVLAFDMGRHQSDVAFAVIPVDGINANRNLPGYIAPTGEYTIAYNLKPTINARSSGVSLRMTYDQPKFLLQSVSSYRTSDLTGQLDTDRSNLQRGVSVSADGGIWVQQEVLYTSKFEGPFNFIGGVFYFHNDDDVHNQSYPTGFQATPGGGLLSLGNLTNDAHGYVQAEALAGFVDGSYELTPKFKVLAGVRYTTETKKWLYSQVVPSGGRFRDKTTWKNTSFRVTGQYKFNDDLNTYATYSTGFKSGTYNATSTRGSDKANPETVKAIEVGLKARLAPAVNLTLSAFRYKYDDIQVSVSMQQGGVFAIFLSNAGNAEMYGGEAELTARLNDNLQVRAGMAYLPRAKYTKYAAGLDTVPRGYPGSLNPSLCPGINCGAGTDQIVRDLSGTRILRAPKLTFNFDAQYKHDLPVGRLEVATAVYYTSKFYRFPGARIDQKAYSVLNGTVGWWLPGDHVRLSVWGRNLTDTYYGLYTSPNSGISTVPAAPREIGFGLDIKY